MKEGLEERNGWEIMSRRKYSPGDGVKRGKKGGEEGGGRERPQNENLLAGYLGWTPVSSHVRKPRAPPLFRGRASLATIVAPSPSPSFYLIRVDPARGNFHGLRGRTKHRFRLKRNNDRPSPLFFPLSNETGEYFMIIVPPSFAKHSSNSPKEEGEG